MALFLFSRFYLVFLASLVFEVGEFGVAAVVAIMIACVVIALKIAYIIAQHMQFAFTAGVVLAREICMVLCHGVHCGSRRRSHGIR